MGILRLSSPIFNAAMLCFILCPRPSHLLQLLSSFCKEQGMSNAISITQSPSVHNYPCLSVYITISNISNSYYCSVETLMTEFNDMAGLTIFLPNLAPTHPWTAEALQAHMVNGVFYTEGLQTMAQCMTHTHTHTQSSAYA